MSRKNICGRCGNLFNQVGLGRPRRYCDDCKGAKMPKATVTIGAEEIPGRIERTDAPTAPPATRESFDLALSIVRAVAAGRPCHQEAIAVLRKIEG